MGLCSVYELSFPNGKKYIGISSNPRKRWSYHCYNATTKKKTALYDAIRFYGKEQVRLRTLLVGTIEYAKEMEVKIISKFGTQVPRGYNINPGGDYSPCVDPMIAAKQAASLTGFRHSEKTKNQMSAVALGKPKSAEHRQNISKGRSGMKFSDQHRLNVMMSCAITWAIKAERPFSILERKVS